MKRALLALAALVAAAPVAAQVLGLPGQQRQRPANPLDLLNPPPPPQSQPLTAMQALGLGLNSLRPAYYLIRPLNAQLCLSRHPGGGFEQPHLRLAACDPSDPRQQFAVLLHGGATAHTLRTAVSLNGAGQLGECATAARGVVLGPPRIDLLPCEVDGSGAAWARGWGYAGAEDQRVRLTWQPGVSAWRLSVMVRGKADECWAMRGDGAGEGTDVIRWPCNGNPGQSFNLTEVRRLPAVAEAELIRAQGWTETPDGWRYPAYQQGVSLGGIDYAAFDTAEDGGAYCKARCLESPECKAFTWTGQAYDRYLGPQAKGTAMCHLKSSVGTPLYRGRAYEPSVASGVIRP